MYSTFDYKSNPTTSKNNVLAVINCGKGKDYVALMDKPKCDHINVASTSYSSFLCPVLAQILLLSL